MDYEKRCHIAQILLKYLSESNAGTMSNEELIGSVGTISEKTGLNKEELGEFLKGDNQETP